MSTAAPPSRKGFVWDSLLQFAGSASAIVFGFVGSVLLARSLEPQGYGAYSLGITFAAAASAFGAFGWSSASIYRLRRRMAPPAEVFSLALAAAGAGSLLLVTLSLAMRGPLLRTFFPQVPPGVFEWALILAVGQVVGMVLIGVALGLDRFALSTLYRSGSAAGAVVGVVVLVALDSVTASGALAVTAIAYVVAALGMAGAIARECGWRSQLPASAVRESVTFGAKNWAQMMATAAHEQAGAWILAAVSRDPAQVAYYALALSLVNRLRLLPDTLGMALLPRAAGLEEREGARFTALVLRHSLVWCAIAGLALGFAGIWLIPVVFGKPFAAAVVPFLLLMPTAAAATAFLVVARYFESIARQETNVGIQLVALVVNVGLGILLAGAYGAKGVAVAALASNALLGMLCLVALARVCDGRIGALLTFGAGEGARYREALRALRRT